MLENAEDNGPYIISGELILYAHASGIMMEVAKIGDELAVFFDEESGTLIAWGHPDEVEARFSNAVDVLSDVAPQMASVLKTIHFVATDETVAELNNCISTTDRILRFEERLYELLGPSTLKH